MSLFHHSVSVVLTISSRKYQKKQLNQAWPGVYIMAILRHRRWSRKPIVVSTRFNYLRLLPQDLLLAAQVIPPIPIPPNYTRVKVARPLRLAWGGSSPVTSVHQVEHRQITFRRSRALARATSSTQGPACPRHPFNQIIHRHIRRLNHMNQGPNAAWMTLVSTQVRLLCPLMALTGDLRRIQKRVVRAVLMEGMHFTMAHH